MNSNIKYKAGSNLKKLRDDTRCERVTFTARLDMTQCLPLQILLDVFLRLVSTVWFSSIGPRINLVGTLILFRMKRRFPEYKWQLNTDDLKKQNVVCTIC